MESKTDEYRRKAEDAETKAETTRDLSAQLMYRDIAEHYRYLADQEERMDGWRRLGMGVPPKPPGGSTA